MSELRKSEGKYSLVLMQKMATVAATADGLAIEGNNFKVGALIGCPDMVLFACERIAELERDHLKNDLLIMSNARRLIKAKARTSNGRLYSELFGAGMGTGRERCRKLGLDPDCNKTNYHSVIEALKEGKQ
jgi:hypothetical protein